MSHKITGCNEYNSLSRRSVLKASAAMGALAMLPAWLPRATYAASHRGSRDILISVVLRGGADGLTMCVPHGDADYYALRPTQNIPRPDSNSQFKAVDLDGFFGLCKGLSPLKSVFDGGDLAIVHAVGGQNWTRSHFDAMKWMETSSRDITAQTGWLGRHIAATPAMFSNSPLRALSMTNGVARMLEGGPNTLPIPNPDSYGFESWNWYSDDIIQKVSEMYAADASELSRVLNDSKQTIALLDAIEFENYTPASGLPYPEDEVGKSFKATAALMRAQIGLEAIHIDIGDWDTHSDQGTQNGHLANKLDSLGKSLATLHADLNAANQTNWTLVLMSEFGRTAAENDSSGTDHGTGGVMMAMGSAINGGQVYGQWPGLATEQLFEEQDLASTTDYRQVLAEIASRRLGSSDVNALFPGLTPAYLGIAS